MSNKCECGKPAKIFARGKNQCWDCFDLNVKDKPREAPTPINWGGKGPNT